MARKGNIGGENKRRLYKKMPKYYFDYEYSVQKREESNKLNIFAKKAISILYVLCILSCAIAVGLVTPNLVSNFNLIYLIAYIIIVVVFIGLGIMYYTFYKRLKEDKSVAEYGLIVIVVTTMLSFIASIVTIAQAL